MKKIILGAALLLTSFSAMAHGYEYRGGYRGGYDWIAPMAIGGFIGYQMNRPQPIIIYQQPQVIYQQSPQIYVYPVGVPLPAGMRCDLRTEFVNGVQVTNNYCYY
jgi:hypothetical protein